MFLRICAVLILPALSFAQGSAAAGHPGKPLYDKACKACHGAEGQGNPAIAKSLKITLRDLKSPEVQKKTDEQWVKDITVGTAKKKPVKSLTTDQIRQVIAYVRSLAKK